VQHDAIQHGGNRTNLTRQQCHLHIRSNIDKRIARESTRRERQSNDASTAQNSRRHARASEERPEAGVTTVNDTKAYAIQGVVQIGEFTGE
jgi:hypothetical protein